MTDEPLMTIGTFSRATLLSTKSLRAYHERGILVPAAIDPSTGYRAYHPGQLADAVALRRLRHLDLPLAAVKEILDARDPEITGKVLAEHEGVMRARLAETERIVADLQREVERPGAGSPVHVRHVEHQHAIAVTAEVAADDFAAFLGDAYGRLGAALTAGPFSPAGPSGALYAAEAHDEPEPVTAFLPITAPGPVPAAAAAAGVEVIEVPACTVAVAVHDGSYDTIGDTYASLGAWVAYHGDPTEEPAREIYLVSYETTDDPAGFRTEIHWPIRKDDLT